MIKKKLPKSLRKFIRREKARIRREVFDQKEQKKLIDGLYQKVSKNNKINPVRKPTLQTENKNSKINKKEDYLSNGVKEDESKRNLQPSNRDGRKS
jgi:hypothetical protein